MDFETRKQQILDWISIPVNRQVLAGLGFGGSLSNRRFFSYRRHSSY